MASTSYWRRTRSGSEKKRWFERLAGRYTWPMLDMRSGVCALCNHGEVIDAPALEFDEDTPTRLAVMHMPDALDFFSSAKGRARPRGLLRMLVCRSCGFVQWFASAPDRIPVGEGHATKLAVRKGG